MLLRYYEIVDSDQCIAMHPNNTIFISRNGTDKSLLEIEENKDVLIRRQKQIDYGRGLEAYRRYLMDVPR